MSKREMKTLPHPVADALEALASAESLTKDMAKIGVRDAKKAAARLRAISANLERWARLVLADDDTGR